MFRAAHRLSSGALTVFAASGLYTHVVKWIHFPLSLGNGRPLLERPLVAEGGTLRGREMFRQIWPRIRLPRNSRAFTCRKSATWDRRLYFPSKGRHAEDFFALKNPTASAGFEPTNLGTKGQHATSRPPKPITRKKLHSYSKC